MPSFAASLSAEHELRTASKAARPVNLPPVMSSAAMKLEGHLDQVKTQHLHHILSAVPAAGESDVFSLVKPKAVLAAYAPAAIAGQWDAAAAAADLVDGSGSGLQKGAPMSDPSHASQLRRAKRKQQQP
jgi:hypothetical protein